MTTDNQELEKTDAVEEQEASTDAPEASEETEEVDWIVRGPELVSQLEKLEHQLSSERGQSKKVQTQDERLNRMEDHLAANGKVMSRYLDYIAKDDPELAKIRADASAEDSRTQATTAFETRHNRIARELVEIVKEGEDMKITETQATELERLWDSATVEARKDGDTSHLVEVKIQAERMINEADRKRSEADVRKAKEDTKKAGQREKERSGLYDNDIGPSTVSGGEQLSNRERLARAIEQRGGSITTI